MVSSSSDSSQLINPDSYRYSQATQLPLTSLLPHYTHLLLSYGSSLPRPLGIPGSDSGELSNVHSALDFVNWYNGHPAAHDEQLLQSTPWRRIEFSSSSSSSQRHLTVVGAGNVALDVARIVLRASLLVSSSSSSSREALAKTDVPEPVLAALSSSKINRVDVFARRGPAQLAMTNKEVREMMALEGIAFSGVPEQELKEAREEVEIKEKEDEKNGRAEGKGEARVRKRLLDLLKKGSKETFGSGRGNESSWGLNFFRAPKAFKPKDGETEGADHGSAPPVKEVEWNVTSFSKPQPSSQSSLTAGTSAPPTSEDEKNLAARSPTWGNDPDPSGSSAVSSSAPLNSARPTGRTEITQTDMIVSSVGYRSTPLDAVETSAQDQSNPFSLPFDSKQHLIPNSSGRVISPGSTSSNTLPGIYVSGWLARGPVGVIASTMYDAYSVADLITSDWRSTADKNQSLSSKLNLEGQDSIDFSSSPSGLQESQKRIVSYQDWKRIDAEEIRRGKELGKLREKMLCEFRMTNDSFHLLLAFELISSFPPHLFSASAAVKEMIDFLG